MERDMHNSTVIFRRLSQERGTVREVERGDVITV
jgi:hypothetical protein